MMMNWPSHWQFGLYIDSGLVYQAAEFAASRILTALDLAVLDLAGAANVAGDHHPLRQLIIRRVVDADQCEPPRGAAAKSLERCVAVKSSAHQRGSRRPSPTANNAPTTDRPWTSRMRRR